MSTYALTFRGEPARGRNRTKAHRHDPALNQRNRLFSTVTISPAGIGAWKEHVMPAEYTADKIPRRRILAALGFVFPVMATCPSIAAPQEKSDFPEGYDAVQAAPNSHKVVFENAFVRVLEVTVPAPGTTEPMHHHRWPSFFLDWDTGGKTPHVRYLRPGASARDEPSVDNPMHPGKWSIGWMKPESMHAIQVVARPERASTEPPLLRIEIKCRS